MPSRFWEASCNRLIGWRSLTIWRLFFEGMAGNGLAVPAVFYGAFRLSLLI